MSSGCFSIGPQAWATPEDRTKLNQGGFPNRLGHRSHDSHSPCAGRVVYTTCLWKRWVSGSQSPGLAHHARTPILALLPYSCPQQLQPPRLQNEAPSALGGCRWPGNGLGGVTSHGSPGTCAALTSSRRHVEVRRAAAASGAGSLTTSACRPSRRPPPRRRR